MILAHEQHAAQPAHLPAPVVGLNRTHHEWTAHLADGRTAPVSERTARALLATARISDHWSFGIYANWCISINGGQS